MYGAGTLVLTGSVLGHVTAPSRSVRTTWSKTSAGTLQTTFTNVATGVQGPDCPFSKCGFSFWGPQDDIAIDAADDSLFAFSAPAGAKKVEIAAGDLSKWYFNLDEAKKVAKASNRMLFVDFNATWCGPCQMYKREVFTTAEFKAYGKYFVFVDIDTDEQPALAQQFGASAIPDLHFLKSDGTEVHRVIGYKGMALLQDLEKAKDMR